MSQEFAVLLCENPSQLLILTRNWRKRNLANGIVKFLGQFWLNALSSLRMRWNETCNYLKSNHVQATSQVLQRLQLFNWWKDHLWRMKWKRHLLINSSSFELILCAFSALNAFTITCIVEAMNSCAPKSLNNWIGRCLLDQRTGHQNSPTATRSKYCSGAL